MKDTYKYKWTQLQLEIFRLLCIKQNSNDYRTIRGIARLLNKSPTAISNSLIQLEKEGVVKIKKFENLNLKGVELDMENLETIHLKRVENLKLVYESGIVEFLEDKFPGATIILFGSYSRGEDVNSSDIDIAIIGAKEKNLDLKKFHHFFERIVRLNFYSSFMKIHKNLKDNILNGILLSGSVEL